MEYCCEKMRSAIEDWGGVEIEEDGKFYIIAWDDSHWIEMDECPWCGANLPTEAESEE
jgi:hypothetical protein